MCPTHPDEIYAGIEVHVDVDARLWVVVQGRLQGGNVWVCH
jgi:hypothetical protein